MFIPAHEIELTFIPFIFPGHVGVCVCYSSASALRDVWCVFQPHVDLGELIGSSETEDPVLPMPDLSQITEEVQAPLTMWEATVQHIELEKGSRGLGFSILDYQVSIICLLWATF